MAIWKFPVTTWHAADFLASLAGKQTEVHMMLGRIGTDTGLLDEG